MTALDNLIAVTMVCVTQALEPVLRSLHAKVTVVKMVSFVRLEIRALPGLA